MKDHDGSLLTVNNTIRSCLPNVAIERVGNGHGRVKFGASVAQRSVARSVGDLKFSRDQPRPAIRGDSASLKPLGQVGGFPMLIQYIATEKVVPADGESVHH